MTNAVIGALRVNLGIDSAQFQEGLKNAQGALARFGKMAKVGLVAAAAAAGAAAGALAASVKGTIDAADDMSKAAAKIGVPIEELSRLKYAADLSGVSFEGLQTAVGRLSKTMNEAKNGSQAAVDTFAQLGISATNADGSLKSSSQVLAEISDKFAAMPDGAEKTALAMELMGRSGATMIPLLNGGSDALSKLMAEADSFGQVFTAEMGANAEAFNDNISRLQGVFANISAQVASALLPHLAKFSDWLVANGPQIAALTTAVIEGTVALVQFGADVVNLGMQLTAFVTGAWAQFEGAWDGLVTSVHAAKDAAIAAAQQLVADLVAALQALPAKMVEIGGQIVDGLWQGIQAKWQSVKSGIAGLGTGLVDSVKSTLGIHSPSRVMHEVGQNIVQGLQNGMQSLTGSAAGQASSIAGQISGSFDQVGSSIASTFSGFGSSIADAIKGTKEWSDVLSDLIGKLGDLVLQQAFAGLGGGGGGLGGFFSGLFGGLLGFADGGSFTVGGAGGIDSQIVAFRASPNETVDIRKPGQDAGGMSYSPVYNIDARGADQAAIARLERGLEERDRTFGQRVDNRFDTRQTRRTRG